MIRQLISLGALIGAASGVVYAIERKKQAPTKKLIMHALMDMDLEQPAYKEAAQWLTRLGSYNNAIEVYHNHGLETSKLFLILVDCCESYTPAQIEYLRDIPLYPMGFLEGLIGTEEFLSDATLLHMQHHIQPFMSLHSINHHPIHDEFDELGHDFYEDWGDPIGDEFFEDLDTSPAVTPVVRPVRPVKKPVSGISQAEFDRIVQELEEKNRKLEESATPMTLEATEEEAPIEAVEPTIQETAHSKEPIIPESKGNAERLTKK